MDEGFNVYFTSRAAIEAARDAIADELSRVDDAYGSWADRYERATSAQWRAQCLGLARKYESERDALMSALLSIEGRV